MGSMGNSPMTGYTLHVWRTDQCVALHDALVALYKEFPLGAWAHERKNQQRELALRYALRGEPGNATSNAIEADIPRDRLIAIIALIS